MLNRSRRNDVEGNYRKIWLAHDLLIFYFDVRHIWFLGPKKALKWLRENDPEMYNIFESLYNSSCNIKLLELASEKVFNHR